MIDERRFPGRQGRLLFAYLVAERGGAVPRDELAELIWGASLPPSWDKALTGLVSKLRGVRGSGVDGAGVPTGARLLAGSLASCGLASASRPGAPVAEAESRALGASDGRGGAASTGESAGPESRSSRAVVERAFCARRARPRVSGRACCAPLGRVVWRGELALSTQRLIAMPSSTPCRETRYRATVVSGARACAAASWPGRGPGVTSVPRCRQTSLGAPHRGGWGHRGSTRRPRRGVDERPSTELCARRVWKGRRGLTAGPSGR